MFSDQTRPIKDERHVKRPNTPWICFVVERSQSTDFKGIAPTDKIKLIADEWKALSADEKQVSPPPPSCDSDKTLELTTHSASWIRRRLISSDMNVRSLLRTRSERPMQQH